MKAPAPERPHASGLRVALLRSRFNAAVVDGLVAGAQEALREMGASDVVVLDVPGAFELPLAALAAARSGRFDALVALGAVIRGETDHYEHVARAATMGLEAAARESGVPIGFGVLTVTEEAQARARSAAGPENKGREAARAAVSLARLLESLKGSHRGTETQRDGRKTGAKRRATAHRAEHR